MGLRIMPFSDIPIWMGTGGIEVAQRNMIYLSILGSDSSNIFCTVPGRGVYFHHAINSFEDE